MSNSINSPHFQDILFVGCTHGDEQVGRYVFDTYSCGRNEYYQWKTIIGNPEAMMLNTRFIETDLNRSFPGNPTGTYEERRAHQLIPHLNQADMVIDIHQSYSTTPDFMIVNDWTPDIEEIDHYTHFENIIVLSQGVGTYSGLMQMEIPHATAFEYGRQLDMEDARRRVQADIESILNKKPTGIKSKHFAFWKDLPLEFKGQTEIDNFVRLTDEQRKLFGITEENIYPTFIDGYPDKWAVLLKVI